MSKRKHPSTPSTRFGGPHTRKEGQTEWLGLGGNMQDWSVRLCLGLHVLPDGMYRVLCIPPYPQGHLLSLTYLISSFAEIIFPFKLAIASIYSANIKKSISKIDEAVCLCTLF